MKQCNICKEFKEESEFHNMTSSKDGKQSRCKDCLRKYQKKKSHNYKDSGDYTKPSKYHIKKLIELAGWLGRYNEEYKTFEIVGYQHMNRIVRQVLNMGKNIIAIDINPHRRPRKKRENFKFYVGNVKDEIIMEFLEMKDGEQTATYVNLHGDFPLIKRFAERCNIVIAVVTKRHKNGKSESAYMKVEKEFPNAEFAHVGNQTYIVCIRKGVD